MSNPVVVEVTRGQRVESAHRGAGAVVDADGEFAGTVNSVLSASGHRVVAFSHGSAFQKLVRTETFDLVLLDWNLPAFDGIDIVRALRDDRQNDVPIILFTKRADATDIVAGLDAGADDYLTKPVDGRVLLARIDAVMRRRGGRSAETLQTFGSFVFDTTQETVHAHGESVQLTAKEFQLALLLFRNVSRPLSRSYLLETVWNRSADIQTRTLDSHVARLRAKLNLRPDKGWRLSPIYSYGYRLELVEASVAAPVPVE